ncbi:MAG: Holliday junction branch migration protein RuvA [Bacteroidota bacterium]
MIASLHGILTKKTPTELQIDVHGVGYLVSIPVSTYQHLTEVGTEVTILTHLHVREDAQQLFGFASEAERSMFRLLISVSGIGPKIALGILSGVGVNELKDHLLHADTTALTTIPGVGKKTAERLIVELRDKLGKDEISTFPLQPIGDEALHVRSETLLALVALGVSRPVAEKAIRLALQGSDTNALTVEELIKRALRHTA